MPRRLDAPVLAVPEGGAIRLRVQPGLLAASQPVLALGGAVLRVSAGGAWLEVDGIRAAAVTAPMLERCWYELQATFSNGRVRLMQRALQRTWGISDSGEADGDAGLPAGPRLLLAADAAGGRFGGRIEDPALLGPGGAPVASWDFSVGIGTDAVSGTHPGRLVNLPMRGVRGSRWTGAEMAWTHAPQDYAAIHFHADDLYDAEWGTDFAIMLPAGLRSRRTRARCVRGRCTPARRR